MLSRLRTWITTRTAEASEAEERPGWVDALLEALQKQGRTSVKHAARLEGALTEQAARIEQLARQLERPREPTALERARDYAPLFDALDALDEAQHVTRDPHLRAGLALVSERIHDFCARAGFRRPALHSAPPDPRLCRVVGTATGAEVPAGNVERVVRAAVLHDGQVVREGEVIVAAPDNADNTANIDEVQHEHVGN